MLKGNSVDILFPDLIPILVFFAVVLTIGVIRYSRTLE